MAYNKNEPKITNLWQKMTFVCGKYDAQGNMCKHQFQEAMLGRTPSFECPACHNSISFYDVEKFASFIAKTSVNASKIDEDINFTNCKHQVLNKYTKQTVTFLVLEDKKGRLKVAVSKEGY